MKTFFDGIFVSTTWEKPQLAFSRGIVASCLMGSLLVMGTSAQAATKTWDGGGATNNFSDGPNWTDDAAPVATDSLVFAGTTKLAPVNDFPAGTQFNGITFSASAGAFTLSGSPVNLGGDLIDLATATETINFPLALLQDTGASVVTGGTLTLTNPGVTATATATITSGSVTSVAVNNGGSGYFPNSAIPVTFSAPPVVAGNTTATGVANTDAAGIVTSVTITNGGSGYTAAPTITILPPVDITDDAGTPRLITKTGAGRLLLSGRNTFSGGIALSSGEVALGGPVAIGQSGLSTGPITFGNGATLTANGFAGNVPAFIGAIVNPLVVPAGVTARLNTSQRGGVAGTLTGAGTLNIFTAFIRSDFSGNFQAFTGPINIFPSATGGDFRLLTNTVFGNNSVVNLASGANVTQVFNPPSGTATQTVQTIGELNGVAGSFIGGQPVVGRFVNLTVGGRNTNSTFSGVIRDTAVTATTFGATRLTKVGTGILTLTGANTYSGITTVNAGTLAGTGALGFILAGAPTTASATTFNTGSTHAPGVGTIPVGAQPVNGNYTLNNGSTLLIGSQSAQVRVTGTVTLGSTVAGTASTVVLAVTSGFASSAGDQFTIISNDGTDAVVGTFADLPEGAQVTSSDGTVFTISYAGGTDANDVVLTVVTPGTATGTANSFGRISEFRTGGPAGVNDEFIEIFNTTDVILDLSGFSVVAGGVTIPIPAGRVMPPRSRLLLTNSTTTTGYSLGAYATGDVTFTGDIADGSVVQLRNPAGAVVDEVNASNLMAPTAVGANYSYVRRMDGTGGIPLDTGSDSNDFNTVDTASLVGPNTTTGVSSNVQRLGAPGPENLNSPVTSNSLISFAPASVPSIRNGSGNSGTLALRNVITNRAGSGRLITGFRFRVVALTAGTSNPANPSGGPFTGPADVRLVSSTTNDGTVLPLTLQQPPAQANGGGLNSTVTISLAALPGGGLAPGQAVTVEFLFNVVQRGNYRYLVNFEPVTSATQ